MSTKLPWSTKVSITVKFSISTVITMESSYTRSIDLKSTSVKVIEGIIHLIGDAIAFFEAKGLPLVNL